MYCPHTVTLYNVRVHTNPVTFEDVTETSITILDGVFCDDSKGVNVNRSGLVNADAVNLYIPFGVRATDAVSGNARVYASPMVYKDAVDKSLLWTLEVGNSCFFVKGAVVEVGKDFEYINKNHDDVHVVTKVDTKDFGSKSMRHWEVGGA